MLHLLYQKYFRFTVILDYYKVIVRYGFYQSLQRIIIFSIISSLLCHYFCDKLANRFEK